MRVGVLQTKMEDCEVGGRFQNQCMTNCERSNPHSKPPTATLSVEVLTSGMRRLGWAQSWFGNIAHRIIREKERGTERDRKRKTERELRRRNKHKVLGPMRERKRKRQR